SLESIVRCEHKYWSRLVQREVAPEAVPGFGLVDLDAETPRPPRRRLPSGGQTPPTRTTPGLRARTYGRAGSGTRPALVTAASSWS
ncbi:hypothetical protein CLM84_22600, partial [Streptomyces albidoflavus]